MTEDIKRLVEETRALAWKYLDGVQPAADAPVSDNPSGLYCPACRATGLSHCSSPEYCGEMRPMRLAPFTKETDHGED